MESSHSRARRTCGQLASLLGRLAGLLALGLSLGLLIVFILSSAGLIDWSQLNRQASPPWDSLLSPDIVPRTLLITAGEAAIYLLLRGLAFFLTRPRPRALLGDGTLTSYRRAVLFCAWLPTLSAAYLLLRLSPANLRVDLQVHGDLVTLTLPTLAVTLLLGLASMATPPSPKAVYLPGLLRHAALLPFLPATLALLLSLPRLSATSTPGDDGLARQLLVQSTLLGVDGLYLLVALEAALADWADFRQSRPLGLFRACMSLGRMAIRLAIFLAPVLLGLWLAAGLVLPAASVLTDRHGQFIQFYHPAGEYRVYAAAGEIPPIAREAVDAIEDPGIYSSPYLHLPLDPVRVVGIFSGAARSLQDRDDGALSGGSGVAAQLCKNRFGRPPVEWILALPEGFPIRRPLAMVATMLHKVAFELPCGWAYERSSLLLGVERSPIDLYLNAVYFGQGAFGIQAASLTYFGKQAGDLTISEAALLAGLPQAPSYLDPWQRPDAVMARRHEVLGAMAREGYISETGWISLDASPLGVLPKPREPDYVSHGLSQYTRYLMEWLQAHGYGDLSSAGLIVTTSVDYRRQMDLEEQLRAAAEGLAVAGVNNGGAVVLDPRAGSILAWFGGLQPLAGPQALPDMVTGYPHQPGSTLKPMLYACALEEGQLQPDERLDDTPRVIGGKYIANWDLDPAGRGNRPARDELAESRNTAAAELTDRLTPGGFARCLRERFRVQTDLHPEQHGVELGLGLAEMPILELAAAYTVLANGGIYAEPTPIVRFQDRYGRELYRSEPAQGIPTISPETAAWLRDALSLVSLKVGISDEVATKTGTTTSSSFVVGYSSDLLLAAWLGRTEPGRGPLAIDNVDGREAAQRVWKPQAARPYPE